MTIEVQWLVFFSFGKSCVLASAIVGGAALRGLAFLSFFGVGLIFPLGWCCIVPPFGRNCLPSLLRAVLLPPSVLFSPPPPSVRCCLLVWCFLIWIITQECNKITLNQIQRIKRRKVGGCPCLPSLAWVLFFPLPCGWCYFISILLLVVLLSPPHPSAGGAAFLLLPLWAVLLLVVQRSFPSLLCCYSPLLGGAASRPSFWVLSFSPSFGWWLETLMY